MQLLSCIATESIPPLCVMAVGSVYAFPIFNHLGSNLSEPSLCDCNDFTATELANPLHNCNVFRFLSGFLYYNSDETDFLFGMIVRYGSVAQVNKLAHKAMFIASSYGQNSPLSETLTSPQSLYDAYQFCNISGITCSLLTVTSYDNIVNNWAISSYFFQLQNGACRDAISPTISKWYAFLCLVLLLVFVRIYGVNRFYLQVPAVRPLFCAPEPSLPAVPQRPDTDHTQPGGRGDGQCAADWASVHYFLAVHCGGTSLLPRCAYGRILQVCMSHFKFFS